MRDLAGASGGIGCQTAHVRPRVAAALLIHPATAFASHTSAARVYGVPLPDGLVDEHVSVATASERLRERGCPDLPHRLDDEWRLYFPVKHDS